MEQTTKLTKIEQKQILSVIEKTFTERQQGYFYYTIVEEKHPVDKWVYVESVNLTDGDFCLLGIPKCKEEDFNDFITEKGYYLGQSTMGCMLVPAVFNKGICSISHPVDKDANVKEESKDNHEESVKFGDLIIECLKSGEKIKPLEEKDIQLIKETLYDEFVLKGVKWVNVICNSSIQNVVNSAFNLTDEVDYEDGITRLYIPLPKYKAFKDWLKENNLIWKPLSGFFSGDVCYM